MIKLSCFVACAFDKNDVDEIYDRAIEPVIKGLGMKPHRVDRIEHNDDIDDKIVELIKDCDVCVADLTYARPSVYYEAGHFQGLNKPVVFTVRKDHFIPKETDLNGIYRIHFDLQMKNIIGWSSTKNIKTFTKRLKNRLQLVTEPILKLRAKEDEGKKLEKQFNSMPQTKRLASLSDIVKSKMIQLEWKEGEYSTKGYLLPSDYISFLKDNKLICYFILNSATVSALQYTYSNRIIEQHRSLIFNQCHLIIISLRKIPNSRIDDLYSELELLDEHTKTYRGPHNDMYIRAKPKTKINKIESYYHFISNIKSLTSFEQTLDSVIDKINKIGKPLRKQSFP